MKGFLVSVGGLLFGAGLMMSGMTDPWRVIGFLDIFGDWDPALAYVMGGAVVSFAVGLYVLKKSSKRVCGIELPDTSSDPISMKMVIGSAIFGVGWGLGGFCPGPAVANIAVLRTEALWFVPAMLIGMFVARRFFGVDS